MIEDKELDEAVSQDEAAEAEIPKDETESDNDTLTDEKVADDDHEGNTEQLDYNEIAAEDLSMLKRSFPELKNLRDITELQNPIRYAALRDLGLTAEEAYLATNRRTSSYDNRAHLTPSVPGSASVNREMSRNDYDMACEIFSELSDAEIRKLYRKVTK